MSPGSEGLLHLSLLGEAALNADSAVFIADEDDKLVAANDVMCELTGLTREKLVGRRVADLRESGALSGTEYRVETRVASLPYTLGFVVPDVEAHRRRRRR